MRPHPLLNVLLPSILLIAGCHQQVSQVNLVHSTDPDIVLIDIGEGDPAFISRLLLKIDSLKPVVTGVDIHFYGRKKPAADSALMHALQKLENDILIYHIREDGSRIRGSDEPFSRYATDSGYSDFYETDNLVTDMKPWSLVRGKLQKSFALSIVSRWKPGFQPATQPGELTPVHYRRTLEDYFQINGNDLVDTPVSQYDLQHKIILLGYFGGSDEDKLKTPVRFYREDLNQSEHDMYSIVITANEIRTLLENEEK